MPQSSQEVEAGLETEVAALQILLETNGLPVKKAVLDKVRRQLSGLAAVIDVWWEQVKGALQSQRVLMPRWQNWVEAHLLPLMYWEQQIHRTRHRGRKASMVEALKTVQTAFETHPFTAPLLPEVLMGWKAWAAEHVKTFQRASSAVEGRNGYLSQMHHHHRGLPKQPLQDMERPAQLRLSGLRRINASVAVFPM